MDHCWTVQKQADTQAQAHALANAHVHLRAHAYAQSAVPLWIGMFPCLRLCMPSCHYILACMCAGECALLCPCLCLCMCLGMILYIFMCWPAGMDTQREIGNFVRGLLCQGKLHGGEIAPAQAQAQAQDVSLAMFCSVFLWDV